MKRKSEFRLKEDRVREGVGIWTAFYRANPHRLGIDYLGMKWMKPFQQILLNIILKFTYFVGIASRGMGKSMIVGAAIVIKCILYPKSIVVICAGNRGQSTNLIKKIVDIFMPASANLRNEIEEYRVTASDSYIKFKNGSTVSVATARESARSNRATWIIGDEFVQIKKEIIDGVIRKFKAGVRMPEFYNKPEYKDYPKEPNCETYISSAFYKYHYSWDKFKSYFKDMMRGKSYACVGLPYQLPVSEGYYPLQQVIDEMSEADFDSVKWSMEMQSLFWGESSNAFYAFDDMDKNRIIFPVIYPRPYYAILNDAKLKYKSKENGEIRLIGMDIATQGGAKNDNTCFTVLQLIPNGTTFLRRVIYIETCNGGHSMDQATRLRQLFNDYDADYVVIDSNGVGIGVYDCLVRDIVDNERSEIYPAWSCANDENMAARCNVPFAPKIIYSIKANAQFNNDIAVSLRDYLKRGKIKLPALETDAAEFWFKNKAYQKLKPEQQVLFQAPYYQTSMLINEMINLSYEMNNGKIRVIEQSNMRKDRYSSLAYANAIANELEKKLLRPRELSSEGNMFAFTQTKSNSRDSISFRKNMLTGQRKVGW